MRPLLLTSTLLGALATAASAQPVRQFTAADYDRAVRMLGASLNQLVVGGNVNPNWLADDRFWYRNQVSAGYEFVLVDPAKRTRSAAFDHVALAAALSKAAGTTYTETTLPFQTFVFSTRRDSIAFDAGARRWSCDVKGTACVAAGNASRTGQGQAGRPGNTVLSPDGKRAAFIRDWNLWVRDLSNGQEKQLTTDGVKDFGYATDNAGWVSSDRPILLWSPDSRKIATQQQDERKVGEMYLVETKAGHPTLKAWKYPLPGDSVVAMIHRVIIDVDAGKVIRLQTPPDFHRAMLGDNLSMADLAWNADASQLAFVSTSRDHKSATVRVADANTGVVRTVFDETVPTHYESRIGLQVLWGSNEILWNSERDDWSQLYLYDLTSGKLKHQITTGEGPVTQLAKVDEKARVIWFVANGREAGQNPYYRHYYRIDFDGKNYRSLTPEPGRHLAQLSPDGKYLVDTYSTTDQPNVVVLRDAGTGKVLLPLERADITKLLATGWKPPLELKVKAADGKTDLYGLIFRPTNFDSTRKYPIINNAYPGPQSGSTGPLGFTAARGDRQALAELGFIVVTIDGRGTPDRSKSFHDAYYGAMGRDNTLPDQVAGMQDLARRYPWIDIDRAAMWGHSGGGFITADAMFRYPDFFKVGIAESGNHDQRMYEDDWGERYQGLLVSGPSGDNYAVEANQSMAKNLKGKLLLAHGTMDDNVPPYNTDLVVEALIKANKDFDLLMLTNQRHGYGTMSNYMMRRRWDYFVKWLLGAEPPKEYEIKTPEFRPVP